MKVTPVPNELPSKGVVYQLITPEEAVAPIGTVPWPHLSLPVVPVIVGLVQLKSNYPYWSDFVGFIWDPAHGSRLLNDIIPPNSN